MQAGPGRPKGSINHRSLEFRQRLDEVCEELGFDLIHSTVIMARDSEDESIRIQARRILTDHAYPKLKSIDYEGNINLKTGFSLTINRPKGE